MSQGVRSLSVPLTTILSHVIPNHPVDGVFRRGRQAPEKCWRTASESSVTTDNGWQILRICRGADNQERASCGQ
jgi:hypothetical protein